jgi:hypothetical protein
LMMSNLITKPPRFELRQAICRSKVNDKKALSSLSTGYTCRDHSRRYLPMQIELGRRYYLKMTMGRESIDPVPFQNNYLHFGG